MLIGKSVLVVDDEAGIRKLAVRALVAARAQPYEAENGDQAIETLERVPIDLVLIDIIMPGKQGIDTIRAIKPRWPNLKLIAMSGGGYLGSDELLRLADSVGADMTMNKPLSFKDLAASMALLLNRKPSVLDFNQSPASRGLLDEIWSGGSKYGT
jgi:DNA-binding response OmpR family regulator